jgi:hypothetical protein
MCCWPLAWPPRHCRDFSQEELSSVFPSSGLHRSINQVGPSTKTVSSPESASLVLPKTSASSKPTSRGRTVARRDTPPGPTVGISTQCEGALAHVQRVSNDYFHSGCFDTWYQYQSTAHERHGLTYNFA